MCNDLQYPLCKRLQKNTDDQKDGHNTFRIEQNQCIRQNIYKIIMHLLVDDFKSNQHNNLTCLPG